MPGLVGGLPDGTAGVAWPFLLVMPDEELVFVEVRRNCDIEEADHHLIVGLIAPLYRAVGIGIVFVMSGVVVPGNGLEICACLKQTRFGQTIT